MKKIILSVIYLLSALIAHAQSPWTTKADMPTERWELSTSVVDGKIYAIGGSHQYGDSVLNTVEEYDPVTDTWTTKTSMPTARDCLTTSVVNGKIYAIGGCVPLGNYANTLTFATVEEYDPITDTWTTKSGMPTARAIHNANVIDGKIYVSFGGQNNLYNPAKMPVEVYDPASDTWTTKGVAPVQKMGGSTCVVNGKIYAFGGFPAILSRVDEYDPVTDTWTQKADMPIERMGHTSSGINGNIYIIAGYPGASPFYAYNTVHIYDPVTETWIRACDIPTGRISHSTSVVDGKIYVIGGNFTAAAASVACKTVEEYDPHIDLFPLVEKFETDKNYAKGGVDSVLITAELRDTAGLTLYAVMQATDDSFIDSIRLFDDGLHKDGMADDSIYANKWPVITTEHLYDIHLYVTRISEDTVYHQMKKMDAFTSAGPITVDHYSLREDDLSPNPGDRIYFELALFNNGLTETAREISAEISSLEPLIEMGVFKRGFDDIAVGEIGVSTGGYYYINISEDCPIDTEAQFQVDIYSGDKLFWTDTFSIIVEAPDNINDISSSIARIYPNPTHDELHIEFDNTGNQVTSIMLYDITGKVVYSEKLDQTVSSPYTINLSSFREGLYFINISNEQYSYTEKVIKVE